MELDDERCAYAALALTPGIGVRRLSTLLAACQTATGALRAPVAFLESLPGISLAAATAIASRSIEDGRRALAQVAALGGHAISIEDEGFPAVLREIPDPPTLLFALGDISLLGRPAVAVVGSRDHSAYGGAVCRDLAGVAARADLVVVSGMARGLDAVAHTAALEAGGATIGVLGNGLGVIYPAANRELYTRVGDRGLLLTEFPPGERPGIGSFPRRNRLISGLARVTVVVEAAEGSGTLITVGTALDQGREVMVVPGNITSPTSVGTNRLLRDGATPLLDAADLLEQYPELAGTGKRSCSVPPRPTLTGDAATVYGLLESGPLGLDEVVRRCALPAPQVLAVVTGLELTGHLGRRGGMICRGDGR